TRTCQNMHTVFGALGPWPALIVVVYRAAILFCCPHNILIFSSKAGWTVRSGMVRQLGQEAPLPPLILRNLLLGQRGTGFSELCHWCPRRCRPPHLYRSRSLRSLAAR